MVRKILFTLVSMILLQISPVQASERDRVLQYWEKSIETIATQSHDREAEELVEFMKEIGAAVPNKNGYTVFPAPDNIGISFMVLLQADVELSDYWSDAYKLTRKTASYDDNLKIIFIKDIKISATTCGIIGLHELNHAYSICKKRCKAADLKCELMGVELSNRLEMIIGGHAYDRLVQAEAERLQKIIQDNDWELSKRTPVPGPYNHSLDKIFGQVQSDPEKISRQTHLWVAGYFRLLESEYRGDIQRAKATFVNSF
jgi:hypothetical protein